MSRTAKYSLGLPTARDVTIHRVIDGSRVPVLSVEPLDRDPSLSIERLAHNAHDLLNGDAPAYRLGVGADDRIFYTRSGAGIVLKVRPAGEDSGVATPVAAILAQGNDPALSAEALQGMDNLFMKALCDAIEDRAPAPAGGGPRHDAPRPQQG